VNFRNTFNQTLLMVSAHVGNKILAKTLLEAGANINLTDNAGENAFQIALRRALFDRNYAEKSLSDLYHLLSPDNLSIQADGKLIKIDKRNME
ncbi:ankyrin repeat domain-containing protein, partial [Klebsiella pneumoniae]|uniref:ankyrin repeat domain-containing protein n=1 Tax=Klebsiella pneumoniae TaxID=573 RepID=UPI00200BD67D